VVFQGVPKLMSKISITFFGEGILDAQIEKILLKQKGKIGLLSLGFLNHSN
jgi:hypothetical protein